MNNRKMKFTYSVLDRILAWRIKRHPDIPYYDHITWVANTCANAVMYTSYAIFTGGVTVLWWWLFGTAAGIFMLACVFVGEFTLYKKAKSINKKRKEKDVQ